jgi:hypothetical protein
MCSLSSSTPRVLWLTLTAHNASVLDAHFRATTHSCPICLNRLPGTRCISLSPCSHVACRDCLGRFWGHCIKEGDVARVGCPDPNCVKENRQASTGDVKAVVSDEEVVRWQRLLRKREVEQGTKLLLPGVCMRMFKYDKIQRLFTAQWSPANSQSYPHRLQKTVAHRSGIVSDCANAALRSACIAVAHGMVHTPHAPSLQQPNLSKCISSTQKALQSGQLSKSDMERPTF